VRFIPILLLIGCGVLISTSQFVAAQGPAQDPFANEKLQIKQLDDEGRAAFAKRDFRLAIDRFEKMLALEEKVYGRDHIELWGTLQSLGYVHSELGEYEKAIPLLERSLAIVEKHRGPEGRGIESVTSTLATALHRLGQNARALPLQKRALALLEKSHAPDSIEVGIALYELALIQQGLRDYSSALALYSRSLGIIEKAHGANHPEAAAILESIASTYRALGDTAKAQPYAERALAIRKKIPDSPQAPDPRRQQVEQLFQRGMAAAEAKNLKEAIALYEQALALAEQALGKDHSDLVLLTDALGMAHRQLANYPAALRYFERSLALDEKRLGPDHGDVADDLNNLGLVYRAMGEYAKALPLYHRSLSIREKALGPDDPQVATSLNNLAVLYLAMGEYARTLPLYQRSLAIYEKALGPEHPNVATSLSNLAAQYQAMGDYAKALPLYQRSLAIREKALGPEHPSLATSLNNLAELYRVMGEYAKALPLYQQSLAIYEKVFGPGHPNVATSLGNLAGLHRAMGEHSKALPLYQKSLAIDEQALGANHPSVATSLNNLAGLYQDMGEYAKALPLYQSSLSIREKALGPGHPDLASGLNALATLYQHMGEHVKALALHQGSLAIRERALGRDHPDVAQSLNNLAGLYYATGEYAKALPLFQRSLAIDEKAFGPVNPNRSAILNNLAALYWRMGEFSQALPIYQRNLSIAEKTLGAEDPVVASTLFNLATLYRDLNEYGKALPLLEQALRIASATGNAEAVWRAQNGIRTVLTHLKLPELAVFFGKQSVNTIQGMRAQLTGLDQSLQRSFLGNKESVYRDLADLLSSQGRLAEAQQVLGMLKEEEFFEFIRRSESDDSRKRRIAFQPHEQPWQDRFQAMQGKVTSQADFDRYFAEIRQAFAARAGTQVAETADAIANRAALQKTLGALGAGSVMLHFVQSEERLNIIVTTASNQSAKQIPLKVSDLNQQIDRLRRVLRSPQSKPLPAAQELYQTLIAPIAADLDKAGAKTLMFYLDGSLRYIPMAVLHDGKQFLAERYALAVYTEVASSNLTHVPADNRTIAGLGLTRAIEDHDALPAVKAELESIVKIGSAGLIPGEVHLDEQFSARTFLASLAKGHALVHVASHFVFRPGTEATSYLLLGDGDRLTLKRIRDEKYDFGKVDLLTLSACETGLGGGRDAGGQEVEGLGVLVQRQGAKGVIATLWPVADASTALFMQHMYRLREQNLTKAEALRQAQIALIRAQRGAQRADAQPTAPAATKAAYAHPYFWAPFILMGNWL
jgi:tetratricopeptide (TPR) repeat protein